MKNGRVTRPLATFAAKGKWYLGEVERKGKQAAAGVEAAERQAIAGVEREVLPAIERVIQQLVSEGIKPVLKSQAKLAHQFADGMDHVAKTAPPLVKEIEKVGFDVDLKVNVALTLEYKNFWTRAREVAGGTRPLRE